VPTQATRLGEKSHDTRYGSDRSVLDAVPAPALAQSRMYIDPELDRKAIIYATILWHAEECGGEVPMEWLKEITAEISESLLKKMYITNYWIKYKRWRQQAGKETVCAYVAAEWEKERKKPYIPRCAVYPEQC
jgi:hypothetical protein